MKPWEMYSQSVEEEKKPWETFQQQAQPQNPAASTAQVRPDPMVKPEEPGFIDDAQRQLGLTVRAGVEGAMALPSLLAEPIRLGLNLIPGVQIAPQQQMVSEALTRAGVPQPETTQERIVGKTAEALAGAAAPIGVGKSLAEIAPTISKTLMASPGLQALSAASGGAAMETAKEAGIGEGGQLAAGVAASIAAPTAAGLAMGAIDAVRHPILAIKTARMEPQQRAQADLATALRDDGISVEKAIQDLKKIGPEAMISDLGENVSSLARRIESVPGFAKQIATKELSERQLNRNKRVTDAIKNSLGNGDDFFRTVDDINLVRKTASAPKYKEAYDSTVKMTDEIKGLLDRPATISAWKKAQEIASNEGIELPKVLKVTDSGIDIQEVPDMRTFDYIKRGLDDVIQAHTDDFGRIKTDVGRSVQAIKKQLVSAIDKQVPAYKDARNIFSGHSSNLDALNKGRGFLKDDSDITSKMLKSMSESEKEMFRVGASRAIRDKILSAPDGADAYKRIFGNELLRSKLKTVFPSVDSYKEFARMMKSEKIMTATRQKITGGSPTARIQAEQAAGDIGIAEDVARGNLMTAATNKVRDILDKAKAPSEDVSNQLAGMLFTREPETNIRILQGLEATLSQLPPVQQEKLSKLIIKAMAAQQANIAAQSELTPE